MLVLSLPTLLACTSSSKGVGPSPPKPGDRVLAISMNPRQEPPATAADFLAAFDLAHGAGARGNFISYPWGALESDTGRLDISRARDDVSFAASRGMQVFLGIQLINTTAKEVPLDLKSTPFDSPRMKARFHTLIDSLAITVLLASSRPMRARRSSRPLPPIQRCRITSRSRRTAVLPTRR